MPADDRSMYEIALKEARSGKSEGGIPIGAALAEEATLLGAGRNRRLQNQDPTAHAEIDCLRAVGPRSSYARTTLYTTLTPCFLCSGAIVLFGIPRVVVGEIETYDGEGSLDFLAAREVEVVQLDDEVARRMLKEFIDENRDVWLQDIGK